MFDGSKSFLEGPKTIMNFNQIHFSASHQHILSLIQPDCGFYLGGTFGLGTTDSFQRLARRLGIDGPDAGALRRCQRGGFAGLSLRVRWPGGFRGIGLSVGKFYGAKGT